MCIISISSTAELYLIICVPETLFIKDVREGEVPGTHIIKYRSAVDDIEIMHKAHNRQGFALGAVIAAEYIYGKKGIFTMNDLM